MIDTYKFRGLSKDGKLVYGDLIRGTGLNSNKLYILREMEDGEKPKDNENYGLYETIPMSLSLYTGYKTEAGTPIYENDKVQWNGSGYVVVFKKGCFFLEHLDCGKLTPLYKLIDDETDTIKENLIVVEDTSLVVPKYELYIKGYDEEILGILRGYGYHVIETKGNGENSLTTNKYGQVYTTSENFEKRIDCEGNWHLFARLASIDKHCSIFPYQTVLSDAYAPKYEKGKIYYGLSFMSDIHPSAYRDSTLEEIIENSKKKDC